MSKENLSFGENVCKYKKKTHKPTFISIFKQKLRLEFITLVKH